MSTQTRTIVVGVDSTASSTLALLWAAQAAHDRRLRLDLVHAIGYPTTPFDAMFDDRIREGAHELVEKAAARVRESWPDVPVATHVEGATATYALGERSRRAELVVVGTHRLGRAERVFAGSLSYGVAAAAWCPVVVVPRLPEEDASGVVVGADGSADGLLAVRLAAKEAERAGQELHVVHAWQEPATYLSADYVPAGFGDQLADAEAVVLGESVAGLADAHPDLVVHQHLVHAQPAAALLELARTARLVVVGSRGRTGVARALLGSVSHAVVLNATCPVMVVRTREHATAGHR